MTPELLSYDLKSAGRPRLLKLAEGLAWLTLVYNLAEGGVSVALGLSEETLALAGFGLDSFVECLSAAGVLHLLWRLRRRESEQMDRFGRRALRVTAAAFFILAAGLVVGAGLSLWLGLRPETTTPGIVVSLISLATMYFLYRWKLGAGRALDSAALVSDAQCTRACFWLSGVLLASSLAYEALRLPWLDVAGALGVAWFAAREGREAYLKAANNTLACADDSCG